MRVTINIMMTKRLKEALLPSSSLLDLTGGAATIKGQPLNQKQKKKDFFYRFPALLAMKIP